MDNQLSHAPLHHDGSGAFSLIVSWAFVMLMNILSFTDTVTLDTVQKVVAIVCSIVVAVITVMGYFKGKKPHSKKHTN